MEMTREEATRIIKECKEKGFKHTFHTLNAYYTALDMAIDSLETWDKIFAEYESLTDQIVAEGDEKHATERIDAWCIDMLRSVISDYYARRIIEDANRKYV